MGLEIDGAIQHAPQRSRHCMVGLANQLAPAEETAETAETTGPDGQRKRKRGYPDSILVK